MGLREGLTYGHGLQHLRGTDRRLACQLALGNHGLLRHKDVRSRDLNTEITSGNHDTIGFLENLVKVGHALQIFNLGDNLDVSSCGTECFTDRNDVFCTTDEGGENHVYVVLDTELKIGFVLF